MTLFLDYDGVHIPEERYRKWFDTVFFPVACKDGDLDSFYFIHKTRTGEAGTVKVTLVLAISTPTPMTCRKKGGLDWDGRSPLIRSIPKTELGEIKSLFNEDIVPPKPERKMGATPRVPVPKRGEIEIEVLRAPRNGPDYTIDYMLGWQLEAIEMMNKNSSYVREGIRHAEVTGKTVEYEAGRPTDDPRRLVFVVLQDPDKAIGRTTFLNSIKHDNSKRFLIITGVPSRYQFLALSSNMIDAGEWNGDCVIFDVPRVYPDRDIHETLASCGDIQSCRNVWLFSDWVPELDITYLRYGRWRFHTTVANWYMGMPGQLDKMDTQPGIHDYSGVQWSVTASCLLEDQKLREKERLKSDRYQAESEKRIELEERRREQGAYVARGYPLRGGVDPGISLRAPGDPSVKKELAHHRPTALGDEEEPPRQGRATKKK